MKSTDTPITNWFFGAPFSTAQGDEWRILQRQLVIAADHIKILDELAADLHDAITLGLIGAVVNP